MPISLCVCGGAHACECVCARARACTHTRFSRSATFLHDSRDSLTKVAGNKKKSDTEKLGFSCVGFWMKKLQYPESSAWFYILLDRKGGVVAYS